jgi:purine-nucleoside phosphorylase
MNANAYPTRLQFQEATAYIRERTAHHPSVGLILGSGLSSLANEIQDADSFPYAAIPHFAATTVHGHTGRLVAGKLEGQTVLVMQGRFHFYEGHTIQQVTFPIRVMRLLGIESLIVTNAAGGISAEYTPGDLMLIGDHINFVGMGGHNPLIGPNDPDLGPRFPDMSQAYDPGLREVARQVAQAENIPLREGVYACLAGPSFETPAEIRYLRLVGADAVGMSTVHEVIVARHMGLRVLGISGISNVHSTDPARPQETSHQEVLETGRVIAPRLMTLLRGILRTGFVRRQL